MNHTREPQKEGAKDVDDDSGVEPTFGDVNGNGREENSWTVSQIRLMNNNGVICTYHKRRRRIAKCQSLHSFLASNNRKKEVGVAQNKSGSGCSFIERKCCKLPQR